MVLGAAGALLVCLRGALLVLPGPGLLLVLAGVVLLARAIPAFHRFVAPVRRRAFQAARESVASPLRMAGAVLAGLLLIAAGVLWGLVRHLPFSGWSSGTGLLASGLVLLGLLGWSYRRVHSS